MPLAHYRAALNHINTPHPPQLYPEQAPLARVVIVEAGNHLLSGFDTQLSNYALRRLRDDRCDLRLGAQVVKVCKGLLSARRKDYSGAKGGGRQGDAQGRLHHRLPLCAVGHWWVQVL